MNSADPVSGRRTLVALSAGAAVGAVLLLVTVVVARVVVPEWGSRHLADLVAISLLEVYGGFLVGLLLAFGPGRMAGQLGLRFTSFSHLMLALGAWVVSTLVGGVLTAALVPLMGEPTSNAKQILSVGSDPLFVALIAFTVCLLGPLVEELVFRGALLGWLGRRLPALAAVVISALIFAGAHFIPTLLPFLFVLGITTGLVRWHTGSTVNSLVVHVCQNTLAVAATLAVLR